MVAYHPGTAEHSERVGAIARRIGVELGLDGVELEALHWAGLLHDIGKLGVAEEILTKPGPLTSEEWVEVERHPVVGSDLMHAISAGFDPVAAAIRAHHERWDGSGYPDGLAGTEIPLAGRVVAIADVYDALTHARTYRPSPHSPAFALEHLAASAGRLFDRDALEAFRRVCARPQS